MTDADKVYKAMVEEETERLMRLFDDLVTSSSCWPPPLPSASSSTRGPRPLRRAKRAATLQWTPMASGTPPSTGYSRRPAFPPRVKGAGLPNVGRP